MFSKPAPGRPWYKRMTIAFGALFAVTQSLEAGNVIPPGTTQATAAGLTEVVSGLGVLIGMYRQIAD
jgi:uncharacterized membrane protein YphA (DoxX/SURF4 family)